MQYIHPELPTVTFQIETEWQRLDRDSSTQGDYGWQTSERQLEAIFEKGINRNGGDIFVLESLLEESHNDVFSSGTLDWLIAILAVAKQESIQLDITIYGETSALWVMHDIYHALDACVSGDDDQDRYIYVDIPFTEHHEREATRRAVADAVKIVPMREIICEIIDNERSFSDRFGGAEGYTLSEFLEDFDLTLK